MYNFVCRLILSQKFLYIANGFPEIIPLPVQLPVPYFWSQSPNKRHYDAMVWDRPNIVIESIFIILAKSKFLFLLIICKNSNEGWILSHYWFQNAKLHFWLDSSIEEKRLRGRIRNFLYNKLCHRVTFIFQLFLYAFGQGKPESKIFNKFQ